MMPPFELKGVFPPMITPFAQDESLDLEAHLHNVRRWNKVQLGGYVVLGSNSETVFLNEAEKLQLIEATAREAAPGRRIIAGTGLESTRATIRFTREAAKAGAEVALVITPHFYGAKMDENALVNHFQRVAEAVPIPVLLYHVSKFTHLTLSPAALSRMARHPNLVGMKDSSGSIPQLVQYQAVVGDAFQLMAGTASIWYPALCLGVQAAVMALANCAPQACVDIQAAFEAGHLQEAEALYRQVFPLNQAVTATWGIAGLKHACALAGYQAGYLRAPLYPLPTDGQSSVENAMKKAGAFE